MTPVILDQRRFDIRFPAVRADRATGQALLVGLLGLALVAILVARPPGERGVSPVGGVGASSAAPPTGTATNDATPSQLASTPSVTASPVATPEPSASTIPPTAAPSSGPSAAPTAKPSPQPTASGATYKVKSGDTLSAIAARFGTTTRVLVALNDLADPSKLKVGQVLKLP